MIKMKRQKSMSKPPPLAAAPKNLINNEQFELELCWCVQQLQDALYTGKLRSHLAEDTIKNIKLLKSKTTPLIKKRQIMKAALGDYRSKMKEEERQLALVSKQIRFTTVNADNRKACFVKKSAFLNSEENFKFDFTEEATESKEDAATMKPTQATTTLENIDENASNKSPLKNALNLTSGAPFKFNFNNDDFNDTSFNELSIEK